MVPCKKAEDMTAPPIPQNLKDPLDSGRRPDMTVTLDWTPKLRHG